MSAVGYIFTFLNYNRINIIEEGMPRPISTDKPTLEEIKRSEGLIDFLRY